MLKFPSPVDHVLPHEIKCISPNGVSKISGDVNRFVGSLVGLAVGDALGASAEFRPHQYFVEHPVRDMEGGGTWGLKAGQWTDDTSMALCLASSLISKRCFDPYDQMVRYKWWFKHGYMSSTGHCFDIGNATRDSLEEFSRRQKILYKIFHCHSDEDCDKLTWDKVESVKEFNINCSSSDGAGNGALMRLAPIPLFFYQFPQIAVEYAGRNASLTHGDRKAVDACRYYAALIVAAVNGESITELLRNDFYEKHLHWFGSKDLDQEILQIAHGSYKRQNGYEDGIRGKGYIVKALEAALWAVWSEKESFEKGALAAVNLGDDTDTTAAIYGQLAGACYGYQNIPKKWIDKLYAHKLLVTIGQWIYYEGTKYKLTEKEQKIISTIQPSTGTSSTRYDQTDNYQPQTHLLNTRPSQTTYLEDNRPLRGQRSVRELPIVDDQNARRIPRDQTNEIQVSSRPPITDYSSKHQTYPEQLHMHHRTEQQPSTYQSHPNLSSAYNSSSHPHPYTHRSTFVTGKHPPSAYGSDFGQRSYNQPDSRQIPRDRTNIYQSSVYDSDVTHRRIQQPHRYIDTSSSSDLNHLSTDFDDLDNDFYGEDKSYIRPSNYLNDVGNHRHTFEPRYYRKPISNDNFNRLNSSYDIYTRPESPIFYQYSQYLRDPTTGATLFTYGPHSSTYY
jgi:ADP-ribosyl-[dinitrogen reductase] hydrolase